MAEPMAGMAAPHGADPAHADDHHHTSLGVDNLKLAFWVFLGSDCFFFGSLIGTYMSYRGKSLVGPYPAEVFSVEITSISTFLLLMSSLTMVLAVRAARLHKGDALPVATIGWMLATAAMGATFVGFQVYEFNHFYHEGLTLQGNLFGSTFYTLTGFHGTHVAIGVLWLLLQALVFIPMRWIRGDLGNAVDVAGLYWHFVDIVWIVIFTLVYLLEFVR
jgi:heme/copper-type cytochrome/quinol oxidase subunit 3